MVAAGFTFRKIKSEQTLGEKLKRARKRKGVDLIEAELSTKVRAKYIEALESEDFELLPNEIYVKGFLETYCQYLGLDFEAIYKLYLRQSRVCKNSDENCFTTPTLNQKKTIIITPKLALVSLAIIFCLAVTSYVIFQVFVFASVPKLAVYSPVKDAVVNEESVKVSGKTDPGAELKINKEPIAINSEGAFEEQISLQSGLNTIVISVTNKAGKENSQVYIVERKIKTAEAE